MPDHPQAKALLKAAIKGDVGKIRELLGAGVPLESTDLNKLTPVMLAAQAGHVEAFRTLVDAGANLHALGLDQVDLLECAAEGGHAEIVQFVLDQGHPIEGHWKPRSRAEERMGRITPLFTAAINGRVDAVRLLLQAGANKDVKFDGDTIVKMLQQDIKFPNGDDEVARVPQLKEIVKLLTQSSSSPQAQTSSKSSDVPLEQDVAKFAANARQPAYQKLLQFLTDRCGKLRPWKPAPDHGIAATDVTSFKLTDCSQSELEDLQAQARKAGGHLVLAEPWSPGDSATMVLYPTDNPLAIIAAVGTEGANHGVNTAAILAWLAQLNTENPIDLTFCSHDALGGNFQQALKSPTKLAASMIDLCPDILDDDIDTPAVLAAQLKKHKSFLLRWD